jgi:hypothetical protein
MAKASPAPLDATLLGVPKGAAAPAPEVPTSPLPADPAPAPATAIQPLQRIPAVVEPEPEEEPRHPLTVRLPKSTTERLREAAHRTRKEKQRIVNTALLAWLDEHGF